MVAWLAVGFVKPFRALRYDAERAGRLDDLVAPPHDVITAEMHERLLAASPYNAVRLIRPDDPAEAARALVAWSEGGILVREGKPAAWILEEEFVGPDGVERRRRGLVARVRLEPYSTGHVLPHERTFADAKQARLPLLRATRTKLSPIFLLHEGDSPQTPSGPPVLAATLGRTTSRVWRVEDPREIERELGRVRGRFLIADGHHRYETALRFHEEEKREETAYVLAALVSREDKGVTIFPTHRVVDGTVPELDGRFRLTDLPGGAAEALATLAELPRDRPAFVLLSRDRAVLAESDHEGLDTEILDDLPLEGVRYTPSAVEAEAAVRDGSATAAFLVRAPTLEQVEEVALAGERLPEKTTYFYPKLTCGLLFAPFDE
jgi:uncharacterized protein (DUF1015 family)